MRFWDSSALLALVLEESRSRSCRDLVRSDSHIIAWTFAPLELLGGCCRKRREGVIDADELTAARAKIATLARRWRPIPDSIELREVAERVLVDHDLKAADALQLAAALVWCERRPGGRMFVSSDEKLLAAARAEGFEAIQPAPA